MTQEEQAQARAFLEQRRSLETARLGLRILDALGDAERERDIDGRLRRAAQLAETEAEARLADAEHERRAAQERLDKLLSEHHTTLAGLTQAEAKLSSASRLAEGWAEEGSLIADDVQYYDGGQRDALRKCASALRTTLNTRSSPNSVALRKQMRIADQLLADAQRMLDELAQKYHITLIREEGS